MATTTNNGWETPDDTDLVKDGALAMRTLGNAIDTSVGEGLLAWKSYAPSLANGWANGNGTWNAAYLQIGKMVFVRGRFTFGSTTTKSANQLRITLPVSANTNSFFSSAGGLNFATAGGGTTNLTWCSVGGADYVIMNALVASGTYLLRQSLTSTVPATWTTGDSIDFNITYEAA